MNKIKFHNKKMSFLNKVRFSYGLLIMIPILLLEIFVLYTSTNFIREQQQIESKEIIERNYQDIQNQIAVCERSLLYLVSNSTLKDFMNTTDDEYLLRARTASNVSSLLYNTLLSNQYFSKVEIYSEKKFAVNNAIFKKITDYDDSEWYQVTMDTTGSIWWYEEGKYFITRRIVSSLPEKKLGVILIEVKDDVFLSGMSVFDNVPITVQIRQAEEICFEYASKIKPDITGKQHKTVKRLEDSGWEIIYQIDESHFSNMFHPQIVLSFVVVVVLLVFAMAAVNYSTKSLLKYLYRLIHNVKKVKGDNFEIQVEDYPQDEIGELALSIHQMLQKIQRLIDEIYKSKLEQKSLELDLLQSKMNPHFLYNNLSAINWIAIEKGEDRIYEITTQLATFYRTALNKGLVVDKLAVEIENIKAYISLQSIAHDESFQVKYLFEEIPLDADIPMFIMQPLVENAIEHGVDTLRKKKGEICIHIKEEKSAIVIRIRDNGEQLNRKIGNGQMAVADYGYGVSNVHKRIQLLCGEAYGVVITADEAGTMSTIRIRRGLVAMRRKT